MNQYTLSLIDRTVHYSFCWRLGRPVLLFEVTQISLSLITVNLEMPYFTTVKTTYWAVVYRSPRATHTMSPIIRVQRRPPTTISTIVLSTSATTLNTFSWSLSPKRRRIKLFSWSLGTSTFPRTVWYTKWPGWTVKILPLMFSVLGCVLKRFQHLQSFLLIEVGQGTRRVAHNPLHRTFYGGLCQSFHCLMKLLQFSLQFLKE